MVVMNTLKNNTSLKNYTFLLLATSLLGAQVISIDIGAFQMSPYRLLILLAPFVLLNTKRSVIQHNKRGINYSYFSLLSFWILYSLIQLLWVVDVGAWGKIFILFFSGVLTTWFIGLYLTSKADIITALKIVEFFSFVFGIIAVYEIITGNYMFIAEKNLEYFQEYSALNSTIGIRVPTSVFTNPNNYSLFLIFSIFSSLALFKIKSSRIGRYFSLFLTFAFILLLISTQSRGGFIGLIISFLAYFILFLRKISFNRKIIVIIFTAVIIACFSPFIFKHSEVYSSLIKVDPQASTGSDYIRMNLIKNGFIFLLKTFLLGVGLGNIEWYMEHYAVFPIGRTRNIHNWWMEILVSSGILVFIPYIIIYFKNLWRLFKFSKIFRDKEMQYLSIAFFCFLIAFLIASISASSLMGCEWLWPIIAIIMSFINMIKIKN